METGQTSKGTFFKAKRHDGRKRTIYINNAINTITSNEHLNNDDVQCLPLSATLIKHFKNNKLKPVYWFDDESYSLIQLNEEDDIKYSRVKSNQIDLKLFKGGTMTVNVSDIIDFAKSGQEYEPESEPKIFKSLLDIHLSVQSSH